MTTSLSGSACSFVTARLSFCESASPGFLTLTSSSQAPCLCYSTIGTTTVWAPDIFDGALYTCNKDELYADSTIVLLDFLCGTVGNVLRQSTLSTPPPSPPTITSAFWTTSPTTPPTVTTSVIALTAPPIVGMTYPPCFAVASMVASCISATTMFTDLNGGHQALCLCYRGDPPVNDDDLFDVEMLSCANYLQTANPAFYSNISMLEGFCTEWNGDVQSLLPAISYYWTTIFLNSTTVNSTPSTANPITTSTPTTAKASTTNPSSANSTPTMTAKTNTGSSLRGGISRKLFLALAAVAFYIVLRF